MSKKKILFVVEAMGGGVFTYIVDLANELVHDFDLYIAYSVRPQTPQNYIGYFDNNINLIEVKSFTREINPAKDTKAALEIKRIADCIKPDIIHLHSSKAGAIGRIVFNGNHIPLYYTPHGYSFLMENYSPIKRAIFKSIERIMALKKCTTISCSLGEHNETLTFNKNALYVNNGVNIEKLNSLIDKVEIKDHSFTVFTLGRICHQKNPILFNQIAEAMPDVNFVWIGDGELRKELISKNIEVTGWIQREDALKRCVNGDVFILTSLWEGLPISLLESMYMKKLCIVSDVIGNHDVIINGINGFVCNEVSEYKSAINFAQNKNISDIIDNAYNDVCSIYNTSVMAENYEKIYNKVLKENL